MSIQSIITALENKLDLISPALATQKEGTNFTPVLGIPYQVVDTLFSEPENPSLGIIEYRERGIFQITLAYPKGVGAGAINVRADLIKETFYRGITLTYAGINVIIDKTPSIEKRDDEGDRIKKVVKIRFYSDIIRSV